VRRGDKGGRQEVMEECPEGRGGKVIEEEWREVMKVVDKR
jgi:hypothetical protein